MNRWGDYFFCGVGGSGMTPLALIVQARGGGGRGSHPPPRPGPHAREVLFLRAAGVAAHPPERGAGGWMGVVGPGVGVVNNISRDHKPLDELRALFRGFVSKGETVVLNLDNAETAALVTDLKPGKVLTWSLSDTTADLLAGPPVCSPGGIAFPVKARVSGQVVEVTLKVPGLHNLANARAALSATIACGVGLADAAVYLGEVSGIRQRFEGGGTA